MKALQKSNIRLNLNYSLIVSVLSGFLLLSYSQPWSQTTTHRVLIGGCDLGYTAVVGKDGAFEWKFTEPNENDDAWVLPNGNIIWSYKQGVKMVTPNYYAPLLSKVVWNRPTPSGAETHACQPLDGGSSKFLIGESYATYSDIIEVDTSGKVWKRITLQGFGSGSHNQFRQIRKTPQKTYLVAQQAGNGKAFEYDSTGKLLRTFPDGRFATERLANGNTLIGCGDNHRAIEVDANNNIVWQVGQTDIKGDNFTVSLGFVAGLLRLPNGNTMLCNWGGHGGATGAAVIEITPDKKLVWSISATIPNFVASIQLLDALDSIRPVASNAVASALAQKRITVTFSKTLDSASSVALANYSLNGGVAITAVTFGNDRKSVLLTIGTTLVATTLYTLTINNVLDNASPANKIAAGSTVKVEMGVFVIDHNPAPGLADPLNVTSGYSSLSVYNLQGRLVRHYTVGRVTSVAALVQFLGTRENGLLRGGRYFVTVTSDRGRETHKVVVP